MIGTRVSASSGRTGSRIGLGAFTYTFTALLQRSASLLLLPFVVRVMSPSMYGLVSVVTISSALLGVVLGSALENAVFRWSVRGGDEGRKILSICQFYSYLALPAFGVVGYILISSSNFSFLNVDSSLWAIAVLAACLTGGASYFGLPLIRSRDNLGRFVVLSLVTVSVNVSLKVFLVVIEQRGLEGWLLAELTSSTVALVLSIIVAHVAPTMPTASTIRTLFVYSVPLVPHRLAFWSITSLSRPLLLVLTSAYQVGIFALACNFAFIASLVLGEINRAVLAEYSKEVAPVPSATTLTIARLQLLFAFAVPACLGLGITAFGSILVPPAYESAMPAIGILLASQALYGIYLVPMNYICQTVGDTRWSWIASVSGAATIFSLLLMLGDGSNSLVASVITVCGYAVMCVLAVVIANWMRFGLRWSIITGNPSWLILAALVCATSSCSLIFSSLWVLFSAIAVCGGVATCLLFWKLDRQIPGPEQVGIHLNSVE